jgi:hypothetical protein
MVLGHAKRVRDLDDEWREVDHAEDGMVNQLRLERLGRQLLSGTPIAIRDSRCGLSGDRLTLWLDNGAVLRMKLFWARRMPLATIGYLQWHDGVGWVMGARTTAGEQIKCYGWWASLSGYSAVA